MQCQSKQSLLGIQSETRLRQIKPTMQKTSRLTVSNYQPLVRGRGMGKCDFFIPSHFRQAIPIPTPIHMGIPWDPWEFPK